MATKKKSNYKKVKKKKYNIRKITWQDVKSQTLAVFLLTSLLCVLMICSSYKQYSINNSMKQEIELLEKQMAKEEMKTKELEEKEKFMKTDAYIEEQAREKCGLVKSNELIFILEDN